MRRAVVWTSVFAVAGAMVIALGSCNVVPTVEAPPPVTKQTKVQPAPPPVVPKPEPTRPAQFLLSGEAIQGGVMLGTVPGGTSSLLFGGNQIPFDDEGNFLIAFNRDAPDAAYISAVLKDGRTVDKRIDVAPREWYIERVNVSRGSRSGPSEAFKRRRAPELAQINAARRIASDSEGWRQNFIWPVKGRISGMFGNQRIYRGVPGGYHTGTDIAASTGTPIVAPADGVVILASDTPFSLEGYLLMVDHGMGLNSAFLHLSEIAVKKGDVVRQGQYIGNVGSTGSATGPHLHWGMKWNAARIDPILLTGPM